MNIKVPRKLKPLLAPCRYKGAYGGRGGAKSHFFAEQIILRCSISQTRVVCIREVQNSIKDSVKQLIADKIEQHGLAEDFTILDQEIRGPHDSLIIFKGMQSYNANNIKSLEGFDVAWVEEAQTFSQHSLDILRPTLRSPGSELWFSWNPRYKTDAVDKFFRGKNPPQNSVCVHVNWRDNPWFKGTPLYDDMVEDYAADPDKADHIWGGAYGQIQGAIIAKWVNAAEREGRIGEYKYDRSGHPVIISSDLGYRDTASWWYWQPVIGGFHVLMYDFGHGMDADDWIPEIKKKLKENNMDLGRIYLPHDAKNKTFQSKHTSQQRFQAAFGHDMIRIVPDSLIPDRIEAGRTVIKKCAFDKELCEAGLDGLRAWEFDYNEDAGVFSRTPKHNWASHPSDAFTYGCQVVTEDVIAASKAEPPKFWDDLTVNELWEQTPVRRRDRV